MGALKLSSLCTVLERQARSQCIAACRDVFGQLQLEYGYVSSQHCAPTTTINNKPTQQTTIDANPSFYRHIKQVLTRRLQNHPMKV